MYHSQEALANLNKNGSTHVRQSAHDEESAEDDREPISYKQYIESPEWSEMRVRSHHVWGGACLCCGGNEYIERHHLFYRYHIETASPYEIVPLCRACHEAAHTDDENKNNQPSDMEALNSIVNRLFHKIVRTRGLTTSLIAKAHKTFWKVFGKHATTMFSRKGPPKIQVVKTVYTKKERERLFGKKGRKRRRRKGGGIIHADSTAKGALSTWTCYQPHPGKRRYGKI